MNNMLLNTSYFFMSFEVLIVLYYFFCNRIDTLWATICLKQKVRVHLHTT